MDPLLKQKARSAGALGAPPNGATTHAHHASEVLQACAKGIEQLFIEVMPRLLTHSLDPLSSCARSVVLEFGRQAGALGHPELLKVVREWEHRGQNSTSRSIRPLEVFFPYDPYLLRRSATFLELKKSYVRWRRGHPSGAPRTGLVGASDNEEMWEEDAMAWKIPLLMTFPVMTHPVMMMTHPRQILMQIISAKLDLDLCQILH